MRGISIPMEIDYTFQRKKKSFLFSFSKKKKKRNPNLLYGGLPTNPMPHMTLGVDRPPPGPFGVGTGHPCLLPPTSFHFSFFIFFIYIVLFLFFL
jgi:hypothetical protein